jgi:hypothetical protein
MRKQKKGLELSLTVLVITLLSIIIFIGAIALLWQFFTSAEEIKGGIEQRTQREIEALLRQGHDLVAIPINSREVSAGKETTFGLGIRNIHATQGYYVTMSFSGIYDAKGKQLSTNQDPAFIEEQWLGTFREQGPITIDKNNYEIVPLRVRAYSTIAQDTGTPRGSIVVFNVCVFPGTPSPCEINNPEIYDKIKQVFIEIK